MLIKKINNEDEVVLGSFYNNSGGDLVDGDVVIIDTTAGATVVGRYMTGSGTGGAELTVLGVVYGKTITSTQFGLVLVYGVHRNVKSVDASITTTKLLLISGVTTAKSVTTAATAGAVFGFSLTASVAGRCQAFIKAM